MEETTNEYLMWMKRKQILKSHIQAPIFAACNNKNSWEERAFAEDAARILGGCIWPPRSYSCHFCKREFRSAQALGGHMNVHRRDRARLKQNPHHHKDDNFTTSGHLSSKPSTIFTQENCCIGCPDSEPKVKVNAKEEFLKGSGCHDYVETNLSVGTNSVFGKKLGTDSCGDHLEGIISYKRPKTSTPVFLKPCSNDRGLTFNSAEFVVGLKPGMEDLDLELRLGKPQKV